MDLQFAPAEDDIGRVPCGSKNEVPCGLNHVFKVAQKTMCHVAQTMCAMWLEKRCASGSNHECHVARETMCQWLKPCVSRGSNHVCHVVRATPCAPTQACHHNPRIMSSAKHILEASYTCGHADVRPLDLLLVTCSPCSISVLRTLRLVVSSAGADSLLLSVKYPLTPITPHLHKLRICTPWYHRTSENQPPPLRFRHNKKHLMKSSNVGSQPKLHQQIQRQEPRCRKTIEKEAGASLIMKPQELYHPTVPPPSTTLFTQRQHICLKHVGHSIP